MTDQAEKQPFWEELGLPAPNSRLTIEEYTSLPETNIHIEWHDGIIIYPNWDEETMTASPSTKHARVIMRLIHLLLKLIPNGQLFTAVIEVRFNGHAVQPDVFWVAESTPFIDRETYYEGAPDLIVEVLSSNEDNDRIRKYDLYEAYGVKEYWIINPKRDFIEVYTLIDAKYQRFGAFKSAQQFKSPVLGKTVDVSAIFSV